MASVFDEMEMGQNRVRAALTSAEGLTSQQVGETSALGKALDLPSGVVEADPARARQEMTFRRISEEELFARWAEQRKENAALARDDTDGLSNVFALAKAFGESVANAGNRAMQWLTFEAGDDVQDMGRQLVHGAADFNRSLLGTAQGLSDNLFGAGSVPSKALQSAQEWVKWARPDEVKGDTWLGQLGYDFVRSVPQQAGNIMAALSNPAAALSLMGVQIAGGSYAELRDQGVSPQRALISSLANATMQTPLEKIGLDRFMGIFKSANFRDTVVRTLGSMGFEFVTEYLQKYPELVTNLWGLAEKQGADPADQIAWFGRTLFDADTLAQANREGLYEGLIGAMWGGLGGGVRSLAIRNIERQKALDFAQQSVELHDAVEGSQTKQVAPDYMEDALDNASDVLAQSVYIPAQAALDLAAQGQDVLTPLGITADQVQQAVETGVDLEVKMSSLQSRLDAAGMAAVSQIMRQNPDAPNAVEASQVDAAAQAQAVVEETRKRQRRADAVLQEEQRLVREMLPLVGKDAAETYGKLHSAQARAFEAAYGVDAAGLMKRRSVGLEDSGATAGTSFDQTAYHGTPHKGHIDMMNRHIEAKKELDSFLNMMKEKYGENIYRDGSDEELETIERLERKAYVENPNPQDISFSDNEVISSEEDDPVEWNKTLKIEPDRIIDPRYIEEINNVTDFDKKDSLVKRFKEDGGFADNTYPIVVVKLSDRNVAITGSHRIIASREAGVSIPVVDIDVDEKYSEKILDLIDAKDDITRYEVALSLRKGKIISKKAFDIIKEEVYKDDKFVLYQGDVKPPSRRAQVQLDSQTAAIRIFRGADMSSIPHETAHIFLDDLQRVAQDDGTLARERLRMDIEATTGMDATLFAGILSGEVDVEGARGMLRDVREELAALDDSNAGLRDAAATAKGKDGKDLLNDISAARKQNTARRRELLPVERMLSSYVHHLDGLEQARSDMRTLRRFAGVAEEGALTQEQWRDVQEYAARGFEQYLAEGKAPVKELNGLFSRMMRWLKNLYASWRQYVGADLDDDVRRVFDRMLATEEQIRDDAFVSAALEYEQDFMEEVNLSADERKEIEDLRSRAEAEVTAKMDRAVARERGKRYRAAFERAKESLQASPFWTFIREMTRRDKPLTEGEASTGGINRDSLVEYLGEDMAKDIAKKMPKLVNAQGKGDTVDSLAMQYPLTDGDADVLANLIYETLVTNDGSVNKLAARHAEQALAEQDREVSPEDGLLAGDAYGQYLEAVEKAMQRLGKEQQAKGELAAARRMEKERLPERYYRNIARQEVANMTVSQLRPDRYVAALRRALSDRSQAVRRGKWVEAVQAMQRARMAFAMMQEVRKARETAERVQKKARKAARVKNGTYPAAQTEAIRKLVEGLGLSAPAQAWDADAEKMTLRELVKASVDDTEVIDLMPIFPDWLLDLENPDPVAGQRGIGLDWKHLVSLEIKQVENLLDFLVHSGREQSKADKASLASRVQAVADAAAASMSGLPTYYAGQRDSVRDDLDKGFSSIDSLEWQARKADGFQNVPGRKGSTEGVMERDVYGALRAATDRYHVRLNSTQRAVTPHLVRLLESAKAWEKKYGKKTLNIRDEQGNVVPVPEEIRRGGDTGWTAEMVIGMALNMGNAGNRERLRSSYADEDGNGGLSYDMVSLLLGDDAAATLFELDEAAMAQITAGRPRRDGILSAADWKAIQGVWDVMGSQWADTQAAHKRIYGFAPQGIEPGAFTVRVGDDTVRLPGGYYPIKYDPRLDMKMRAQEGKENILDRSEGIFGVPAARKGFTMGRVQHTGRSLRLGVDALQKHLVDSARLIELAYDVRMADKVINNPAFAAEYQRAFGIHDYDRIRPNLKALVVDEVDPDSRLYRWSELARKHLVYYALSLNLNTALMQLTAVFPAVGDVGTLAVSRGLAQLTTRGMGLVRDVWAASPYMERRFRNIDQDLARKALKFKPGRGMTLIRDGKVYTWEDVANLGMSPIAVADLVITTAIWSGAYHKKMKELRGTAGWKIDKESAYHDQAVAYADKLIAQSNPDNDALSRSAFGRDKGIVRLFNSFSGATTKFAQRTRYGLQGLRRGKVTPWEFGRMEIYDMLLPALGMTVMAALMQGAFGGDDDDNEQLAKLILSNTLGQVAMAVPVFGNPASDMIAAAMGAGSGRRGELSSALDTPLQLASTALSRGGKAYRDGEMDGEKLLMSALDIGSYIARIPVGPVARRTARGLEQWEEGEGTPFSVIKPR